MEAFLFLGRHSVSISEASFLMIYLDSAELDSGTYRKEIRADFLHEIEPSWNSANRKSGKYERRPHL